MLVLSRKQNQEIVIGDNIKIRVLKIKGNTIRLGIDAPRDVRVVRGELPIEPQAGADSLTFDDEVNVTVVFNNDLNQGSSKLDVIPFRRNEPDQRETRNQPQATHRLESNTSSPESSHSISFRDQLPQTLRHNRLKELVKELTQDKSKN